MHENTKAVIMAALIIVLLGGVMAALALTARVSRRPGHARAAPASSTTAAQGSCATAAPPVEEIAVAAGPAEPADPNSARLLTRRLRFIADLERRYRGRGMAIALSATGPSQRRLKFHWTLKAEPEHLHMLKAARPLWDEVRELGYTHVEMVEGGRERTVWNFDLAKKLTKQRE